MNSSEKKLRNLASFNAVLRLITSSTEFVAREIDCALTRLGEFSRTDREELKRIAHRLAVLGLLARIIYQNPRLQEQRPIRGGRSVNIVADTQKDLLIAKDEEHAITPKLDGGALV